MAEHDIEPGDVVIVLKNDVFARRPNAISSSLTCGEKVCVEELGNSFNRHKPVYVYYNIGEKGRNFLPIKDVEKIYYNDIFKTAWALFGGR